MVVFIGLGSNEGRRLYKLKSALKLVQDIKGIEVISKSPVYETSPVGPFQKNFLNAVIKIESDLKPVELLHKLSRIENQLGRRRTRSKWGPRPIDLDILFFDRLKLRSKELTIPHKEIRNRLFVLAPLRDIAPSFVHPGEGKTVRRIFEELKVVAFDQKIKYFGKL